MASKVRQWRNHESARRESRPSSSDSGRHKGATTMESGKTKTSEGAVAARTEESSSSSGIDHRKKAGLIEIDGRGNISSVAFLVDGEHVVSGGWEEKVRRWRIEDGEEVGTPMDAGSAVCNIAVSRDGKWVVGGTFDGWVTVWNAESQKRVARIIGHNSWVRAVDVSPDGTRIATGSKDKTACVWSLSTGERLVGPLEHDNWVAAVKISPDGCLLAAATRKRHSLRIYHSQDGRLLVDFPVEVNSTFNQSLAWASDSDQLFALSLDGDIHCLDVYTGTTLVKWPIHSSENARCIALAKNSTLIAASAGSSVSFWNTTTREQIGSVIEFTHDIWSMAISVNYDLVVGGERTITFRGLCDILPPSYFDDIPRKQRIGHRKIESANLEETPSVESRSKFNRTLIPVSDIHAHQTNNKMPMKKRKRKASYSPCAHRKRTPVTTSHALKKPSRNSATNSPNLNAQQMKKRIATA
ncbi:WD40 repeat-like protein [Imleria badia]|nr:WD40 repeat-like protein [Imleria badia]